MATMEEKQQIAHDTLCKFIQISVQKKSKSNITRLSKELDCFTVYKPDSIRKWYSSLIDCVQFLQLDSYPQLWGAIFERFRWDFPANTLEAYCQFCITLISTHYSSLKLVLQSCAANLTDKKMPNKCEAPQIITNDLRYGMIHRLLQQIRKSRPTMSGIFMQCLTDLFPDPLLNDSDVIGCYVQQLLMIIQYIPELRSQIIRLIMEQMITLDVESHRTDNNDHKINENSNKNGFVSDDNDSISDQREDDEDGDMSMTDDEDDNDEIDTKNTLDQLMCLMFDYIQIVAEDDNKLLIQLYQTMSRVFESSILSTNQISSVQFLMFYLCSFRAHFAEDFVSRLLRLCTDVQRPTHSRCFAAGFIGGFVAKAKYLRHMSSISTFQILLQWIIAYIQMYKKRFPFVSNVSEREARNHGLFYAVCQAVFRIYSHHQHTFDSMFSSHPKMPGRIYKMCRCTLKPLKYCNGDLVIDFVEAIKVSDVMDISKMPAFGSSKNFILTKCTFAGWQLFPFDCYNLMHSLPYLNGLIRVMGCPSPQREENEKDDWIRSEIEPSQALTPSTSAVNSTNTKNGNVNNNNNMNEITMLNGDNDEFRI